MRIGLLLATLALALAACGDDEPRAPLGPSQGGGKNVNVPQRDGGADDPEDDAGGAADAATEGPRAGECERVPAVAISDDTLPSTTGIKAPADFRVTRQVATWRDDCETLVIELSDGSCPNGRGHELELWLETEAIQDGRIGLGLNTLAPEPDLLGGIRARYTRPDDLTPEGIWGSCAGSSGDISFLDVPDVSRSGRLRAKFQLSLTACDERTNAPLEVSGYFDVRLRRSLTEACGSSAAAP